MAERPVLNCALDAITFQSYYYLKEELMDFCRQQGLQTTGSKIELTERISHYLQTGERITAAHRKTKAVPIGAITKDTVIESPFVCSERHRAFFRETIGTGFSFHVEFQKWLRGNAGKTYQDAMEAYHTILNDKKTQTTTIDRQFEYNTYIRAFFADNPGKTLAEAITCWKYKKSIQGHNHYEKADLTALSNCD